MHTTCEQYAALISAAVDGALAPEERKDLMDHLAQCPACREIYTQMMLMHDAFAQWEAEPPAGLAASVMDQIRRESPPVEEEKRPAGRAGGRRWIRLCAAAACFALIVVGAQVGRTLMPGAGSNTAMSDSTGAADPAASSGTDTQSEQENSADPATASPAGSELEKEDPSVETAVTSFGTSPEDRSSPPISYQATAPSPAITLVISDERLSDWMAQDGAEGEIYTDAETGATVTAWTISFQQYEELTQYLAEQAIPCEVTGDADTLSEESTVRVVLLSISVEADPNALAETDPADISGTDAGGETAVDPETVTGSAALPGTDE